MSPEEILGIILPAIAAQQILTVSYMHKSDGRITIHNVIPYSVEPGKRSKTGKPMFWSFCLDHQRIEQRIPANVLSISTATTNPSAGARHKCDALDSLFFLWLLS